MDFNILSLVFQRLWLEKENIDLFMFRRRVSRRLASSLKTPWRWDETRPAKENKKNTAVPRERCWNKEALLWFETVFGWVFWVREHLRQRQEPRDGGGAAAQIDVLHRRRVIFTGSDGSD